MDCGNHLQAMALRSINDRWGSRLGSRRERSPLRFRSRSGPRWRAESGRRVLTVACGHGSHPSEDWGSSTGQKSDFAGAFHRGHSGTCHRDCRLFTGRRAHPRSTRAFPLPWRGQYGAVRRGGNRLVVRRPELAPRLGSFPRRGRPHPPLERSFPTRSAMSKEPGGRIRFVRAVLGLGANAAA